MTEATLKILVEKFCEKQKECDSCIFFDSCNRKGNGYEKFLRESLNANDIEVQKNDYGKK